MAFEPMPKSVTTRVIAAVLVSATLTACATAPQLRGVQTAADAPSDDASVYGLYLAGEAALDGGASNAAARYLGQASAMAPQSGLIRERAFIAALLAGDVDKAAALAPAAGAGDQSAYALGQITRAVVALSAGQGRAAYDILSTGKMGSHWAAAVLLRPWAAASAGDAAGTLAPVDAEADRAVQAFAELNHARLLERAGRSDAAAAYKAIVPKGGVFALAYGGYLERRGRRSDAVALYDQTLTKDPTDPAFAAARARAASGAPAPAAPSIRTGAAEALIGPAALLLAQKQPDAGLAYLRLSLKLDPALSEGWVLVGDAEEAGHDLTAARAAYAHVPASSPEYVTAQGRMALDLQEQGDKPGALAVAQGVASARPQDPHALLVLAELYRDDERYPEAVQALDRLIASVPPTIATDWRLYFLRGAALEREGRWPQAETDLQKSLSLHPDDPDVLNYLGFAWADRGERLDEALRLIQKADALSPDSGAIVDSLGWAHYRLGDYPAAVRDLERAASLEPADPDINAHLGDAYWRTGRRLEARYQWRRVLTLDPDSGARAAAEAKLANGLSPPARFRSSPTS